LIPDDVRNGRKGDIILGSISSGGDNLWLRLTTYAISMGALVIIDLDDMGEALD